MNRDIQILESTMHQNHDPYQQLQSEQDQNSKLFSSQANNHRSKLKKERGYGR